MQDAPIAQLDRVSDFESEGCGFDSYFNHLRFTKVPFDCAFYFFIITL